MAGGVPRRCVVPPRIWTARYGGTLTSTALPGFCSANHCRDVRTPLASSSGLVGLAKAMVAFPSARARSTLVIHPSCRMGWAVD